MTLAMRPTDRAALTAAACPLCHRHGLIEHVIAGRPLRMCPWCMASWRPTPEARYEREVPHGES
jgi:hypothetical protein